MAAFYSAVIEITDKDDWFITKNLNLVISPDP